MAMKTAVEEVMALCYMLHCLGVKVSKATHILGYNRSIIIDSNVPSSLLKKNHVAISYHMICEATMAKIVHQLKAKGDLNFTDVLTKPLAHKAFALL
eukprot:7170308-Ditylum_brightwellii.AAC.1